MYYVNFRNGFFRRWEIHSPIDGDTEMFAVTTPFIRDAYGFQDREDAVAVAKEVIRKFPLYMGWRTYEIVSHG